MQNKTLVLLAVLIPALALIPFATQDAHAYKLTNKEIKIVVVFYSNVTDASNIRDAMYADFDQGIIEQKFYDILKPVSVGTFTPAHIIADWGMSTEYDFDRHTLEISPLITEINISNGVPQPTVIDALVNDGRAQVRTWLQTYGINDYTWYLYYDGGLQIVEESS